MERSSVEVATPVLRLCAGRVRSLDPARAGDVASIAAMGKVYEGLVQIEYKARPYRVRPLLAEALPEVSDDGLTLVFRIRPGIRFHDDPCFPGGVGREVRASDFVYAIRRIADARNASPGWWAFNDRIVGLDEFRAASARGERTDYDAPIEGLSAPDASTLRIVLKRPYPQLAWILAMHYAVAVPREAVETYGESFGRHPVGTGPYRLASWIRDYRMEYARTPSWRFRGPPAADLPSPDATFPAVERIVEYVIDDATTRWLTFLTGGIDLFADISRDNWDVVVNADGALNDELRRRGIRMRSLAGLNVYYIGFNMDDPVVGTNRKLRQALSCAFDTAEWLRYYGARVARANGPIPPGVAGHREGPSPYEFDPDRARRLLAEAGYPDGIDPATGRRLQLTLDLGATDTEMRESTELIAAFFDRIGVVLAPQYNNRPAFFRKLERREAQMFRLSWFADYPDAENFLQLFYSPNASPGPNRANYRNPRFDRLFEDARILPDGEERTRRYEELAQIAIGDAPWIFLHYPVDYTLCHEWIANYAPSDFPYGMEKFWALDPAARVESLKRLGKAR